MRFKLLSRQNDVSKAALAALFLTLTGGVLAQGCGGGGSNSPISSGSDGTGSSTEPATRLRQLTEGDEWVYSRNMTGSVELSDRVRVSVSDDNASGGLVKIQSESVDTQENNGELAGSTEPVKHAEFFRQDKQSRDLTFSHDNAGLMGASVLRIPGTWSDTLDRSFTANATNYSFKVEGKEVVITAAGTFNTWRVHKTLVGQVANFTGTYWYAPEIGAFVKFQETRTFSSGSYAEKGLTIQQELQATNTRR